MSNVLCAFCWRIERGEYEETHLPDIITFEPLSPVTPGHRLFVPRMHVSNAIEGPRQLGRAMTAAALWQSGQANYINSYGPDATQSVWHLHVHLVPRTPDDGLLLPWSNQER